MREGGGLEAPFFFCAGLGGCGGGCFAGLLIAADKETWAIPSSSPNGPWQNHGPDFIYASSAATYGRSPVNGLNADDISKKNKEIEKPTEPVREDAIQNPKVVDRSGGCIAGTVIK